MQVPPPPPKTNGKSTRIESISFLLNMWSFQSSRQVMLVFKKKDGHPYKVGPLLVINEVITPISRVFSPQLPIYFWPFIGLKITPLITIGPGPTLLTKKKIAIRPSHTPRLREGFHKTLESFLVVMSATSQGLKTIRERVKGFLVRGSKTMVVFLCFFFWVVVSNIFYFHPYLGKIPILTHIFQMG